MEFNQTDPTTGIERIQLDDIHSFRKDGPNISFLAYLNLSSDVPNCLEELACFAPTIAYKAATCMHKKQSQRECLEEYVGKSS